MHPMPSLVAHHIEGGYVYRATRDQNAIVFEVREPGEDYQIIGGAVWDGERIHGANRSDARVSHMMDNFTELLR